jgi:hypothetical protein
MGQKDKLPLLYFMEDRLEHVARLTLRRHTKVNVYISIRLISDTVYPCSSGNQLYPTFIVLYFPISVRDMTRDVEMAPILFDAWRT